MKAMILLAVVVGVVLMTFVPMIFIWSLNTLFGLSIALTVDTWFAALVILLLVTGSGLKIDFGGK